MKDRIKELWRRDIQEKLCEDVDYFIIMNEDSEVGAVQYTFLGSILVFSQYRFALTASEKFGKGAVVEKVTRDELFDRFSDKFDFFALDSEPYVDKVTLHSQNGNSPSLDVMVELLDRRISGKLTECGEVISNVNNMLDTLENRFSSLEHSLDLTVKKSIKESSGKHKRYLQRKTRDEIRKIKGSVSEILGLMIKGAVKEHFVQMGKRKGNFKL